MPQKVLAGFTTGSAGHGLSDPNGWFDITRARSGVPGAVEGGDATAALKAAMTAASAFIALPANNSARPYVFIPNATSWSVSEPIFVPKGVSVLGMGFGSKITPSHYGPVFVVSHNQYVADSSYRPSSDDYLGGITGNRGIRTTTSRTLQFEDCHLNYGEYGTINDPSFSEWSHWEDSVYCLDFILLKPSGATWDPYMPLFGASDTGPGSMTPVPFLLLLGPNGDDLFLVWATDEHSRNLAQGGGYNATSASCLTGSGPWYITIQIDVSNKRVSLFVGTTNSNGVRISLGAVGANAGWTAWNSITSTKLRANMRTPFVFGGVDCNDRKAIEIHGFCLRNARTYDDTVSNGDALARVDAASITITNRFFPGNVAGVRFYLPLDDDPTPSHAYVVGQDAEGRRGGNGFWQEGNGGQGGGYKTEFHDINIGSFGDCILISAALHVIISGCTLESDTCAVASETVQTTYPIHIRDCFIGGNLYAGRFFDSFVYITNPEVTRGGWATWLFHSCKAVIEDFLTTLGRPMKPWEILVCPGSYAGEIHLSGSEQDNEGANNVTRAQVEFWPSSSCLNLLTSQDYHFTGCGGGPVFLVHSPELGVGGITTPVHIEIKRSWRAGSGGCSAIVEADGPNVVGLLYAFAGSTAGGDIPALDYTGGGSTGIKVYLNGVLQ